MLKSSLRTGLCFKDLLRDTVSRRSGGQKTGRAEQTCCTTPKPEAR